MMQFTGPKPGANIEQPSSPFNKTSTMKTMTNKTFFLLSLLFLMGACNQNSKQAEKTSATPAPEENMATTTDYSVAEIYSNAPIAEIIQKLPKYTRATSLFLGAEVDCAQLAALFDALADSGIESLLLNNITCNSFPANLNKLVQLKSLILESAYLDHIPAGVLALPKLESLEFSVMEYNTYTGPIPENTKLQSIGFGSTPVNELGTLSQLPALKEIYSYPNEELEAEVNQLKKAGKTVKLNIL